MSLDPYAEQPPCTKCRKFASLAYSDKCGPCARNGGVTPPSYVPEMTPTQLEQHFTNGDRKTWNLPDDWTPPKRN